MSSVTFHIAPSEIAKASRAIAKEIALRENATSEQVKKTTVLITAGAKKRAPINKDPNIVGGFLKRNIALSLERFEGLIQAHAHYSKFQEFGTGRTGAGSGITPPSFYEYGSSKGIPAQPFMLPAAEEQRRPFIDAIKKIWRR